MTERDEPNDRERLGRDPGRDTGRGDQSREPDGERTQRDPEKSGAERPSGAGEQRTSSSEARHERMEGHGGATTQSAPGRGWGIAALVVSVLALIGSLFVFLNLILAIPGLILGIVALRKGSRGLGITAIILSIVAAVLGIALTFLIGAAVMNTPEFQQMMQEAQ